MPLSECSQRSHMSCMCCLNDVVALVLLSRSSSDNVHSVAAARRVGGAKKKEVAPALAKIRQRAVQQRWQKRNQCPPAAQGPLDLELPQAALTPLATDKGNNNTRRPAACLLMMPSLPLLARTPVSMGHQPTTGCQAWHECC